MGGFLEGRVGKDEGLDVARAVLGIFEVRLLLQVQLLHYVRPYRTDIGGAMQLVRGEVSIFFLLNISSAYRVILRNFA